MGLVSSAIRARKSPSAAATGAKCGADGACLVRRVFERLRAADGRGVTSVQARIGQKQVDGHGQIPRCLAGQGFTHAGPIGGARLQPVLHQIQLQLEGDVSGNDASRQALQGGPAGWRATSACAAVVLL